jgi:hypothetical protein
MLRRAAVRASASISSAPAGAARVCSMSAMMAVRAKRTRSMSQAASAAVRAQVTMVGASLPPAISCARRSTSPLHSAMPEVPRRPWRHALRLARARPVAVFGPVLRRALQRLAAIRRTLAMLTRRLLLASTSCQEESPVHADKSMRHRSHFDRCCESV